MAEEDLIRSIEFMKREAERRRAEREAEFAAYRRIAVAKVNALNGSINVPGKPGWVWVSTWGIAGSRYEAFNKGFSLLDQTPVMVAVSPQRPFNWEIIDLYTAGLTPGEGGAPSSFRVGIHGKNHQIPSEANPGKDPVVIYQPAVDMAKGFIYSGLMVGIRPFLYQYGNEIVAFLGTSAIDLLAYVPATASTHRWVLTYIEPSSNTAQITSGAVIADTSDAVKPDIPAASLPSAFWLLPNGATSLSMTTNYEDARPYTKVGGGNVPTEEGQILFALSATAFTAEKPLIDETTGTIMIDETNWTIMVEG